MIAQATYTVLFYLLGLLAVGLALAVVNCRRLLRAAVALMGVLVVSSGLYLMLGAEFLAGIQVLIYVGGIVVVIVFAVMLTGSAELLRDAPPLHRRALAAVASIAFLALSATVFCTAQFAAPQPGPAPVSDTHAIGRALLDSGAGGYVVPFEVVSLLLLAAVLGGIVVARKTPPPGQPFTSGGDRPGEAEVRLPRSQREPSTALRPGPAAGGGDACKH